MCGPPAGAPPGASWSGCTGLRTPVPTPAGTRGPIPPRSVGVCAGTRNGDEFLVLSWPEDAELGTSGAASLKEDTPCLIWARPLAQVQSLGQTLCTWSHLPVGQCGGAGGPCRQPLLGVSSPPSWPQTHSPSRWGSAPSLGTGGPSGRQAAPLWLEATPCNPSDPAGPGPRRRVSTGS